MFIKEQYYTLARFAQSLTKMKTSDKRKQWMWYALNGVWQCVIIGVKTIKWIAIQYGMIFLMPYLLVNMGPNVDKLFWVYTATFVTYWELVPKTKRMRFLFVPYFVYAIVALDYYNKYCGDDMPTKFASPPLLTCLLCPLFGLACLIFVRWLRSALKGKSIGKKTLIIVGLLLADALVTLVWIGFERYRNGMMEQAEVNAYVKDVCEEESWNIEITQTVVFLKVLKCC